MKHPFKYEPGFILVVITLLILTILWLGALVHYERDILDYITRANNVYQTGEVANE